MNYNSALRDMNVISHNNKIRTLLKNNLDLDEQVKIDYKTGQINQMTALFINCRSL